MNDQVIQSIVLPVVKEYLTDRQGVLWPDDHRNFKLLELNDDLEIERLTFLCLIVTGQLWPRYLEVRDEKELAAKLRQIPWSSYYEMDFGVGFGHEIDEDHALYSIALKIRWLAEMIRTEVHCQCGEVTLGIYGATRHLCESFQLLMDESSEAERIEFVARLASAWREAIEMPHLLPA